MSQNGSEQGTSAVRTARQTPSKRLKLAVALSAMGVLHACGGGTAEDVAEAIGCTFANCKDSPDVSVADLSASYEVIQDGSHITANSILGYRYNLVTLVRLRGGDSLTANTGALSKPMLPIDSLLASFTTSFDGQAAASTVSVDFRRGTQVERSTVTLPRAFVLLNPLGPVTLPLSAGQLLVDVSAAPDEPLTVKSSGTCWRADGTTKTVSNPVYGQFVSANGSGSRYRVDTPTLDAAVNLPAPMPGETVQKVTRCDLILEWRRTVEGTPAAGMHPSSRIQGVTRQSMTVHYDALS
jgi:hypothetical protein